MLADPEYSREFALAGGWRAVLAVPLLHEGKSVGAITVGKAEPTAFSEQQIRLLQTFADQAMIAIENARLFDEVQARTRDLEMSLQQQTATADVLKVISRSTFDLQPVLDTLVSSACRLCKADIGTVRYQDGSTYRLAADYGCTPEWRDHLAHQSSKPDRGTIFGRTIVEGHTVHIPDVLVDPEFTRLAAQKLMGFRAALGVPLIREGRVFGVLSLLGPNSFTSKQIELVETFADQAVIAIENARLFNEVQAKTRDLTESLDQQIATGEVLKAISHSAFDLQPVFDAIAENSVKLCHAERAFIFRFDGQFLRAISSFNVGPEVKRFVDQNPIALGRHSISARAGSERRTVHVADVHTDPEYGYAVRDVDLIRTILAVPMLKSDELVGVITIYRLEVKPFTEKQVSLVETFAAQAVIAVENTRLINELRQSLEDLRAAQDRLIQTEKLASLGQLTAGIAHEIKNPLNFVNNFSALSTELIDEMKETLADAGLSEKKREVLNELTQTLKSNLEKVVQHGKRADSIVKNMLLHSREGSGEHRPVDINAIVDESLNLAYHGARAEQTGFNITMRRDFDPTVAVADVFPQEITRVLLNLISNGFYATAKRKAEAGDGFEPMLTVTTRNLGDKVEICIRDNGIGIPNEVKDKIFNPFFTTKAAGEGTGLGLSMSHDIVVKQHGGTIDVDTQVGTFTEFKIVLPRAGASLANSGGQR
ncbi:GAF domain-containing protein [Bradyrhizobium sp. BR 1432]|uniref:GAF domain-containing protein n=1 Tax=Bradyrhizobium sp. BR 1432 TaxID=3447966 RepID=UPI003EE580C2